VFLRQHGVGACLLGVFQSLFIINAMKNIWYAFLLLVISSSSHAQTWQKMAVMPGGSRDAAVAFSIGNKIYSGGGSGQGNRDFYEYDLVSKIWTKKANIPGVDTNRGFAAGFSIYGKGYIGLGSDGIYAPSCKHDLWEYDPITDLWTRKADYPGGNRDGIGVFVIGNKAYIGGGLDSVFNGDQGFYQYDPATDTWSQKNDLPIGPIIFPSMFSIGNFGYLACGGGYSSEFTDLWRYDPATDNWDQMTTFPGAPRQACATFVLGEKGYVGLGQTGYTSVFKDMYFYDPNTNSWQKEINFPGNGRAWPTAITVSDTAYIGDGSNFAGGVNPMSDWWSLTPATAGVQSSQHESNSINCFPNPVSNKLQITGLTSTQNYLVIITDILGREVLRASFFSQSLLSPWLDVSAFPSGTYNVFISEGTKLTTIRFIKE
jgi:N-acetylneuraminic acid mutarotase